MLNGNRCAGTSLLIPAALARLVAVLVCSTLFGPALAPAQFLFAQNVQIGVEQFDSWIFNQHGDANGARAALESRIGLKIRRVEQSFTLSDDQKSGLRLAGRGDIERFFNRVAHARNEFQELILDQNNINEAFQLTMPLQQELASGLFEDGSLFAKVLRATLDDQQRRLLESSDESRRTQHLEIHAKSFVAQLEKQFPMTAAQRDRLVTLVIENVGNTNSDSRYFVHVLRYRISQLPEEEIEEIFDAGQLRVYHKIQAQCAAIAPFLRQQGMLDDLDE